MTKQNINSAANGSHPSETSAPSGLPAGEAAVAWALLQQAAGRGPDLWLEKGQLRCRAGLVPVTPAVRRSLRVHRAALIQALKGPEFKKREHTPDFARIPAYESDWWHESTGDVVTANDSHFIIKLTGDFELARVQAAMRTAFSRHDLLRSTMSLFEGAPCLKFTSATAPEPQLHDADSSAHGLQELIGKLVWAPFEGGVVLRSFLIRAPEKTLVLGLILHHFVADLWSSWTLVQDVLGEIQRAHGSDIVPGPARPLQYADYLAGRNDWLSGPAADFRLKLWRERMKSVPPVNLPEDHTVGARGRGPLSAVHFQITEGLRERMSALAQAEATGVLSVVLAANYVAMFRALHRSDLVLTGLFAGRDQPALVPMVGNTVNLLPLRVRVPPSATFSRLLCAVNDICTEARRHEMPWKLILGEAQRTGGSAISPMVNFIPAGSSDTPQLVPGFEGKLEVLAVEKPPETGSAAWHSSHLMILVDYGRQMGGFVKYLSLRYRSETIERFIGLFIDSLERCTVEPHATLEQLFQGA